MKLIASIAAAAMSFMVATQAQSQEIKVGSTSTGIPFTFLDAKTNTIQGVMVDLANAVSEKAGMKATIVATDWPSLIPTLNSKKIDVIAAAMAITKPRLEVINFADPIFSYTSSLAVRPGNPKNLKQIADLKNAVLGGQIGTAWLADARAAGVTDIKTYSSVGDIMRDLHLGRIDAAIVDAPQADYLLKQNPEFKIEFVPEYKHFETNDFSFGVRKADAELLAKLNTGIKAIKADGTLAAIIKKWELRLQAAP
jgi:polar amino acid transport system substrate-binding protein